MAAPRRLSRKSIRQPDAFLTFSSRSLEYLRQHRTELLTGTLCFIFVLLLAGGWSYYRAYQYRKAATEYGAALNLFRGKQHREATVAFKQIAGYGVAPYDRLALFYLALTYQSLQEPDTATAMLKDLLNREQADPLLRQLAWQTLGHIQASGGVCKEAAASFGQAAKLPGPFKPEVLLAKARCEAETGDRAAAINTYRDYLASFPNERRATEATLMIQELGGVGGPQ